MSDQFVYFIQADENGPIKIGFTTDEPRKRLAQLQIGNPHELKLLGAIKGSTAIERQFHADLAEWRLQGEWFSPHETVLAAVKGALEAPAEHIVCGGPYCSFCGVCKHCTLVLIAAPGGEFLICDQCVGLSARIVAESFAKAANEIPITDRKEECGK